MVGVVHVLFVLVAVSLATSVISFASGPVCSMAPPGSGAACVGGMQLLNLAICVVGIMAAVGMSTS